MHVIPAQIRFNDIDILGHLNNTVYLSLFDLGKAMYMREIGLRPSVSAPPASVIVDIHIQFIKPVHFGDEIFIRTRCSEIGDKHFVLDQEMVDAAGEERSRCRSVMVYVDPATAKSAPIPSDWRQKLITDL